MVGREPALSEAEGNHEAKGCQPPGSSFDRLRTSGGSEQPKAKGLKRAAGVSPKVDAGTRSFGLRPQDDTGADGLRMTPGPMASR